MIFFDIDTQHDFIDHDGALYVPDAVTIRANLERLLLTATEKKITTVSSRCAHEAGDPEFEIFPPHCLDGTRGAERVFPELPRLPRREVATAAAADPQARLVPGTHYVVKKKVYDLFSNAWLEGLRRRRVFDQEDCVVFGVATDYCVRACALGLAQSGARVLLVEDAIRGVAAQTTAKAIAEMRAAGIVFTNTGEIMSRLDDYPRPSVTVDLIIFTIAEDDLQVLLIRRGVDPFKGRWALPGGFVGIDESLEEAAARELKEEVGVTNVYLEQLYTFGDPKRDPRGRVISVAYFALIDAERQRIVAASDAADAKWHSVFNLPKLDKLAFDHKKILDYAVWRLRNKIEWTTVGYELLPKKFTLSELQRVYEIILQRPVDKRNFRKKILAQGQIRELNETRSIGAHRPAKLYSFRKK